MVWLGIYTATLIVSFLTLATPFDHSIAGRYVATFGNANTYAFVLVIALVIGIYFAQDSAHRLNKVIFYTSSALLFYMILGTGSRKGILGCLLVLGVFYFQKLKILFRRPVTGIALLIVLCLVTIGSIYVLQKSDFFYRLDYLLDIVRTGEIHTSKDPSIIERFDFYKVGLKIFKSNPFFGVGLDNFRVVSPEYGILPKFGPTYSHSNYIEIFKIIGEHIKTRSAIA